MRIRSLPRIVAAAASILLLLLIAGTASAEAAYSGFYGVNAQDLFLLPSSTWDAHLAAMRAGGLDLVRRDASWQTAEPTAPVNGVHTYQWSHFDTQVAAYARHQLRWLPIIDYSTTWSGLVPGSLFSRPARIQDFTAYATALARRYGRGGAFWRAHPELPQMPVTRYEVWNEEDTDYFWRPQAAAPERYADLYLATRSALHAADPVANVMVGGLTRPNGVFPTAFVQRMYAHRPDLRGHVDSFGFHPYDRTTGQVLNHVRHFRSLLQSVGAGDVPIDITEVGWPARTPSEDSARASALARLADQLPRSDCGVESLIPHTWVTFEQNVSSNEDWYGIENPNATPKRSSSAYLSTATRMRRSRSAQQAHICHPGSGPLLRLRVVRRGLRRRRLLVYSRCPSGCRLRLRLLSRPRGSSLHRRILGRRSLTFSSRRRVVRFRISRRRRAVELDALALDRNGRSTRRRRLVRMRALRV